ESFAKVGSIGTTSNEFTCADCLRGHGAKLPQCDKHTPFRHPNLVALGIDFRQSVRNEAGTDIQAIWQKFFQLERHRIDRTISRFLSGFVGHFGADAMVRTGRSGWLSALPLAENLGRNSRSLQ